MGRGGPDKTGAGCRVPHTCLHVWGSYTNRVHCYAMPRNLRSIYGDGALHFVTFSCYHRLPLLGRASRRELFLRTLEQVRKKYDLVVIGYVVMPEHVHLLVSEPREKNLSMALKALKQSVARRALRRMRSSD